VSLVTVALAGVTTLVISGVHVAQFGYRSPSLHVALETLIATISIVAAHLVHGRFQQGRARGDLVLFYALATFAAINLLFGALPAALSEAYPHTLSLWALSAGSFVGAGLLLIAARAPMTPVRRLPVRALDRLVAAAILVGVGGAIIGLVGLEGTSIGRPPFSADRWSLGGVGSHPELVLDVVVAVLFFAAGAAFTTRAERTGEELMTWLAAGSVVAGFARFNFFFLPTFYSDWISTGDVLRVAFFVLLFIGTAREVSAYQQRAAESAVLGERRRMARDLHDGLSQELAFIAAEAKRLTSLTAEFAHDPTRLEHLASAAERALDESRRAIATLAQPIHAPLHVAMAREAEEVAARIGVGIQLALDPTIEVDPVTRETLLRIVREAVSNAGRHGHASRISVELTNGDSLRLRVTDDGDGFDPVGSVNRGFGLVSMQERAKALGGEFRVISRVGDGTEIEVMIP
jgi:signal transduction histidine kinase